MVAFLVLALLYLFNFLRVLFEFDGAGAESAWGLGALLRTTSYLEDNERHGQKKHEPAYEL